MKRLRIGLGEEIWTPSLGTLTDTLVEEMAQERTEYINSWLVASQTIAQLQYYLIGEPSITHHLFLLNRFYGKCSVTCLLKCC